MVLSLVQVVEGFRGVEVVEGYLVAGVVSVVGGGKKTGLHGDDDGDLGDWTSNPHKPLP
jgi:hypothetical protein